MDVHIPTFVLFFLRSQGSALLKYLPNIRCVTSAFDSQCACHNFAVGFLGGVHRKRIACGLKSLMDLQCCFGWTCLNPASVDQLAFVETTESRCLQQTRWFQRHIYVSQTYTSHCLSYDCHCTIFYVLFWLFPKYGSIQTTTNHATPMFVRGLSRGGCRAWPRENEDRGRAWGLRHGSFHSHVPRADGRSLRWVNHENMGASYGIHVIKVSWNGDI